MGILFVIGIVIVIALAFLVSFGLTYLLCNYGIIPLVDHIWDVELPLWPTVFVTYFIIYLIGLIFRPRNA